MSDPIVVAAFYKFAPLPAYRQMREPLLERCKAHNIRGSILLAEEGVNGTIAGKREDIDAVLACLREAPGLEDMEHKESFAARRTFGKMKVRLKREIVTIRAEEADPTQQVGTYVDAAAWNDLIRQDDVLLIDTRNDYEYDYGTFAGAVNPETDSFGDFPEYVQNEVLPKQPKRVAMFCTGGIRCEKATSYLLAQGVEEVYHLRGGILKYLAEMPQDESLWEGTCFVFDEREALDHDLRPIVDLPPDEDV
jgi:UPF0176 protein